MQEPFDDLAMKFIKERVKQMIAKEGFKASDREDLVQDFALHLLECLKRLKTPIRDRQGFFRRLIACHAITLMRRREREKCDHWRECSLSEQVADEDGLPAEMAQMILEADGRAHRGITPRDRVEVRVRADDVATVLTKLPPDLRDLCERLKRHSVAEVARQLDMPRQTLQDAIQRLRSQFEDTGLGEDFEK